ncbi:MAG: hypothetical protein NZ750_00535 [Anaerolineae bacterium]|nr:hypothetical protein [Anaerolineae bacterium]MDW8173070.1 hypothetical protein [Anaerolineae bacterium]
MGRVINTNEPDKRRKYEMRTIAEILRRISQKPAIDDESKDMASAIVFSLRTISDTVEESVRAWEKLNYWKKADDFQEKWWWASVMGKKIEELIRAEQWDDLPVQLMKLLPYFADIEITKFMRAESEWRGRYEALIGE